jgi:hypothetical protein
MRLYNLAKEIASLIWDTEDWYEISDIYNLDIGECETEMYIQLCNKDGYKKMCDYIREKYYAFVKENDGENAQKAHEIYVKLTQGGRAYA